ncbi:Smr/MutS family protein [Echinicola vietnamensis]|uniref:Smr domain-containing protein n=1 Tax=Echinicola vietnamensis (strain DSM 17526 / LMG 23754 / KMM 6221) TaxID=926556 RepID=L0FWP7_ECHVK|nr:Smr/MutS family protein [Echinicola vietnamensis]AGA78334.1 Smr domain-containing protein [Echinicola vietnamensis DSM 17526]
MNIGDKVRLLHGNEEGTITKISGSGRIEIEIEDGFKIPAMKNEVVVIHQTEKEYFGDEKAPAPSEATTLSSSKSQAPEPGLFLSYVPLNDKDLSVHLINNTEKDYLFMASEVFGENSRTLASGNFAAKTSQKIDEKAIPQFEKWPEVFFRFIPINHRAEKTLPAFEKKVKFKASSFFKSQHTAPVTGKKGYLFPLDHQTKTLDINQLNQDLNKENEQQPVEKQFKRPAKEIDLHIEKLADDHEFMSNSEMLRLQMETFEKNLNYAIAAGMDDITFIHGIGNGVLRKEIHKYLSQLGNIKYFQDTQKNRFGYGATLVRIN